MLLKIRESALDIFDISDKFAFSVIDEINILYITSIRTTQCNVICVENYYEQNNTFPIVLKKSS